MVEQLKSDTVWLCGRVFTLQELLEIQETVRMFPKLTRHELANTLCENLEWLTPTGKYKTESCFELLRKLEVKGLIQLPDKVKPGGKSSGTVPLTPRTEPSLEIAGSVAAVLPLKIEPVKGREQIKLWNEYVERYHPLGYKRPFGAHQRYFIVSRDNARLGCILFAASAWALAPRDEWIGWNAEDRGRRLNLIINNSRFLIFPWVRLKNLATKALSLVAKRIRSDWQKRYGYRPVLLETFVEKDKYSGACYRAANWIYLGETTGRGRMNRTNKPEVPAKYIFIYPLSKDFRAHLLGQTDGVDK
jgi:hypothetical protein